MPTTTTSSGTSSVTTRAVCPEGMTWRDDWGMCVIDEMSDLADDIADANSPGDTAGVSETSGVSVPQWLWYVLAGTAGVGLAATLARN